MNYSEEVIPPIISDLGRRLFDQTIPVANKDIIRLQLKAIQEQCRKYVATYDDRFYKGKK